MSMHEGDQGVLYINGVWVTGNDDNNANLLALPRFALTVWVTVNDDNNVNVLGRPRFGWQAIIMPTYWGRP